MRKNTPSSLKFDHVSSKKPCEVSGHFWDVDDVDTIGHITRPLGISSDELPSFLPKSVGQDLPAAQQTAVDIRPTLTRYHFQAQGTTQLLFAAISSTETCIGYN